MLVSLCATWAKGVVLRAAGAPHVPHVWIISFSLHCPRNIRQNKKILCTCIQWSRGICSSQFILNFLHPLYLAAMLGNLCSLALDMG